MKPDFEVILDECLDRMQAVESLQTCLAGYPDQAEYLYPLLAAASFVSETPAPRARPQAFLAGQQRMLEASLQLRSNSELASRVEKEGFHKQAVSFQPLLRYLGRIGNFLKLLVIGKDTDKMKLALRLAIDLMVVLAIGSAYTVSASARSLPGDPTYGVKRTWEQVRLSLTLDEQSRQQLEEHIAEERREEIQALVQLGRQETVEFSGILERIEADQWTAGGLAFQMADSTTIEGTPGIGETVRIQARVQDNGTLLALQVQVRTQNRLRSGEQAPYPGPGATSTPDPAQPTRTPNPTAGPQHTPDHTPARTQARSQDHVGDPAHTAEPARNGEPSHGPGPGQATGAPQNPAQTQEPPRQPDPTQPGEPHHGPNPTQPADPPHEPDPAHHDDPPGDHGSGNSGDPHHGGGHG